MPEKTSEIFFRYSPDPDWKLIQRFLEGDESSFGEVFQKYRERVVNLAHRFVKKKEVAEDIAQDVFIKLYEKRIRVDPGARFSTWLYRVTVNASLDVIRKERYTRWFKIFKKVKDPQESEEADVQDLADAKAASPAQILAEEEQRKTLHEAIAKLPEGLRIPILLYSFENLSYREIAQIMELSEKAVERRLDRAKKQLKKFLQ